jgi:hypothetical protein
MNLNIPKKGENKKGEELYNHQARLTADKTKKFARVREILGGYSSAELLEILVDMSIEQYYDNKDPQQEMLPKGLKLEVPNYNGGDDENA